MTSYTHAPHTTKVLVLMGGKTHEHAVSMVSGTNVLKALKGMGYPAAAAEIGCSVQDLMDHLQRHKPDVVFNVIHGGWGEDGHLSALLDLLQVPYTFSGMMASSIAFDKPMTKSLLANHGVHMAEGSVHPLTALKQHPIAPPYVAKPLRDGSSFGVYIVQPGEEPLLNRLKDWQYGDQVLVEKYIKGRDFFGAVMGDKALPVVEVCPKEGFYDYENKYTEGRAIHREPTDIPAKIYSQVQEWSLIAHQVLGCRGISRSDFRYDGETETLCFLEINTVPGFTSLSLVPDAAQLAGLTYNDLIQFLIEDALCAQKKA